MNNFYQVFNRFGSLLVLKINQLTLTDVTFSQQQWSLGF